MNPIETEYHNVSIRITTLITSVTDISTPCKTNKPVKDPSVIPTPPGINVTTPISTEAVYIAIVSKIPIVLISNASKVR